AIVLDNQGVVIAHPISAKVREMHNLKKLTRRILLKDDAGRPIMGADGYHKTEEAPLEWDQRASLLTSEVLMGRSGIFQDIFMDRQNLTIYYEPVALPGDGSVGNYAILLVRNNSTIFRAKITICVFVFLFTILTILVLIFSFRIRFRVIILLPLKKLSESMKDSDVVHPKPVDLGGDDELDALARTYNQMRQNLAESNRKLGELNEKLEQRVEERTSELKRANEKLSRDILEREKVEADLRRSEELHRGTLEATPDAIIISRLKDGRYLQVNEAFCRYSGYSREEALGQTTADLSVLVNSGDREDIIRAVKEKGEVNGVEIQCRSKSGQAFDGLLSARRLRSGDEERILTVVTNISRIKLAEKEKRTLEKQLMHSRKLESIGTIASGVAHNFRNILNGVSIHNQIIELRYGDFEPLMEISEKIARLVKRGARLVDGLSQFSRKDGGKEFKTVNLSEIVQDVYYMIKKSLDARIDVQMDLDPMVYVTGDAPGLSQVLMNLCNNARDAMPDGGALRITVSRIDQLAKVIISDSGVGMDEETLQKCFDPFFTTKSIDKGSGLGLSTSYGVIKTHGGEIQVSSRQSGGTDFIIVLPGTDVEEEDENEALAPGVIRGNGEKILVVDDDQNWRKPAVVLLKSMGYKAFMAKSGDKALSIYAALKPDIILLDINMPEMDGVTCAEKILKQTPDARIILVSGYDKQTFESLDNHAGDWIPRYISKPIDMLELSRLLDRLLHDGKS
ncbi:MAG: response regulator, partial [Desulfobacterales bacterium]|nr:response regulator [Desulfobacterales bacterium]